MTISTLQVVPNIVSSAPEIEIVNLNMDSTKRKKLSAMKKNFA